MRKKTAKSITKAENAIAMQDQQARNSLTSLVQGAYNQTNLTSFNPILQNNIYAPLTINWNALMYMYKTHGVIQTAVDMPVMDALRDGLELKSKELDNDDITELNDALDKEGYLDIIGEAAIWARLFGGGAIIINTDQDPATPLNLNRPIKRFELYAANRWEIMSAWKPGWNMAQLNPYTQAAARQSEYVYFYGERMHTSRVLTISGKAAPYIIRWQLQGWGMSEVERMVEDFNLYIRTKNVLYDLLNEAKLDVFMFEGFKNSMVSAAGEQVVQRRIELMNQLKNFNNALVLDKNDVFEQKQITFAGLAEVMKENRIGIAAALRMPLTKIFGLSASGFNSGEDDIENYNAMVQSEVRQPMRKVIRKILDIIILQKFGHPFDIQFNYKPLRVLSAVEEETVKKSKTDRLTALFDRRLLTSKEMGELMQKENLVSIETEAEKGLLEDFPMDELMEKEAELNSQQQGKEENGKSTAKEKSQD